MKMSLCTAIITDLRHAPLMNRRHPSQDRARRNLFGSAGPGNRAQCEAELKKITEEASRRWGFDFATETPLDAVGRFEWRRIPNVRVNPPLAITGSVSPMELSPVQSGSSVCKTPEVVKMTPEQSPATCGRLKVKTSKAERVASGKKAVQKSMTDFMKPRKRVASSLSEGSAKKFRPDTTQPQAIAVPGTSAE